MALLAACSLERAPGCPQWMSLPLGGDVAILGRVGGHSGVGWRGEEMVLAATFTTSLQPLSKAMWPY